MSLNTTATIDIEGFEGVMMLLGFLTSEGLVLGEMLLGMSAASEPVSVLYRAIGVYGVCGLGWLSLGYGIARGHNGEVMGVSEVFLSSNGPPAAAEYLSFLVSFSAVSYSAAILSSACVDRTSIASLFPSVFFYSIFVFPTLLLWTSGPNGWLKNIFDTSFLDYSHAAVIHIASGMCCLIISWLSGPRILPGTIDIFSEQGQQISHSLSSCYYSSFANLFIWSSWPTWGLSNNPETSFLNFFISTSLSCSSSVCCCCILSFVDAGNYNLYRLQRSVVSGLVAIQSSSAFIPFEFSPVVGALSCLVFHVLSAVFKKWRFDDVLDVVAVHGGCGVLGVVCAGLFADGQLVEKTLGKPSDGGLTSGNPVQLGVQLLGLCVLVAWVGVSFGVFAKLLDKVVPFKQSDLVLRRGVDIDNHHTSGYAAMVKAEREFHDGLSIIGKMENFLDALIDFNTDSAQELLTSCNTSGLQELLNTTKYYTNYVPQHLLNNTRTCHLVEPPKGMGCIVQTDIQSSTLLWSFTTEMAQALRKHNKVMRSVIQEFEGYEVKTIGDSFIICFSTASQAVRFCLKAQMRLLETRWPPLVMQHEECTAVFSPDGKLVSGGLGVRMGVHKGEVTPECDAFSNRAEYFGVVPRTASEMEHLSTGGFIIITEDVYDEVKGLREVTDANCRILNSVDKRYSKNIFGLMPLELASNFKGMLERLSVRWKSAQKVMTTDKLSHKATIVAIRSRNMELCSLGFLANLENIVSIHDGVVNQVFGSTLMLSYNTMKPNGNHLESAFRSLGNISLDLTTEGTNAGVSVGPVSSRMTHFLSDSRQCAIRGSFPRSLAMRMRWRGPLQVTRRTSKRTHCIATSAARCDC
eukprot:TRINITY_DN3933_c0_g1_i2.p1 TRINITY_DN3933_c0_g1~~TRINITY_DN3933_c0_g1_i2.p1  ORF type:complete len:871 (+),score=77.14 TRINITY_DN3933_c0_g1_i2:39-2615(+)